MSETVGFSFVIFGATGDLTKRKLIPALYSLYSRELLPSSFTIYSLARRAFTTEGFHQTLEPFISDRSKWDTFKTHIVYIQGDFTQESTYTLLSEQLASHDVDTTNRLRLFYMAVSPEELPIIVESLASHNLHSTPHTPRIVIEKPFGHDLESARQLNNTLTRYFNEDQIYRIDHYLGKETVQNILSVRFANILMEPVWNGTYIESIEINAFETLGVEERGGYYDKAGALRDMVQSHLLQIMALTLMDQPERYEASEIRAKKFAILSALRPMTEKRITQDTYRGQYTRSDSSNIAYRAEPKVAATSETETFVGLRAYVDYGDWHDVPIIFRTGKALSEHKGEIIITFRRSPGTVFSNLFCELRSNTLKILLQPNEGVKMKMLIKEPGFHMKLADVYLDYSFKSDYEELPDAYERLLLDTLIGDQSLFTSTEEIEASWKYITGILDLWNSEHVLLHEYPRGANGYELFK